MLNKVYVKHFYVYLNIELNIQQYVPGLQQILVDVLIPAPNLHYRHRLGTKLEMVGPSQILLCISLLMVLEATW